MCRKGCLVNGHMMNAGNNCVTPPRVLHSHHCSSLPPQFSKRLAATVSHSPPFELRVSPINLQHQEGGTRQRYLVNLHFVNRTNK